MVDEVVEEGEVEDEEVAVIKVIIINKWIIKYKEIKSNKDKINQKDVLKIMEKFNNQEHFLLFIQSPQINENFKSKVLISKIIWIQIKVQKWI